MQAELYITDIKSIKLNDNLMIIELSNSAIKTVCIDLNRVKTLGFDFKRDITECATKGEK